MKILDGRHLSKILLDDLKNKIQTLNSNSIPPKMVMILVGENPASISYIKQKQKHAKKVGMQTEVLNLNANVSQNEILEIIHTLNNDNKVHGILIQLPLPDHLNKYEIIDAINPNKDVDGFQAENIGHAFTDQDLEELVPCTPKGVIKLLEYYQIPIKGQHAVIIGHSNIVGKPLAAMLLNRDATISVCNIFTNDLKSLTQKADILISAVGKPNLITKDMVKKGAVVIDVGFYKDENGIRGDVDFENVSKVASYISPVPGGAGPMTVVCLLENTLISYQKIINN